MEMKSLSVKCVPSKTLLMLLVPQTALYFNYNIQNCKKNIQTSNTVRAKYRFLQSTYSQNTQNIILYIALTVKRHKISAMVLISAVACTHTLLCALSLLHKWQFYLLTQIINFRLERFLWNPTVYFAD